ncbi:DEAD domain-containing protein [Aphelenchoides besseyi]|nr:DEAD domain-containing protein [Aphelenchoides besseyi]
MLNSKKRQLNCVLASPSSGNAATKIPREIASYRQPFKSPMTGEIGTCLPLNVTHLTGPRTHRLSATQLEAMDPFEVLNIPDSAKEIYKSARKIEKLYECLSDRRLLSGSNFIISLPTGSGKTLIAELLILKCLLQSKQDCIMILPFVAIVQEKVGFNFENILF